MPIAVLYLKVNGKLVGVIKSDLKTLNRIKRLYNDKYHELTSTYICVGCEASSIRMRKKLENKYEELCVTANF